LPGGRSIPPGSKGLSGFGDGPIGTQEGPKIPGGVVGPGIGSIGLGEFGWPGGAGFGFGGCGSGVGLSNGPTMGWVV